MRPYSRRPFLSNVELPLANSQDLSGLNLIVSRRLRCQVRFVDLSMEARWSATLGMPAIIARRLADVYSEALTKRDQETGQGNRRAREYTIRVALSPGFSPDVAASLVRF